MILSIVFPKNIQSFLGYQRIPVAVTLSASHENSFLPTINVTNLKVNRFRQS